MRSPIIAILFLLCSFAPAIPGSPSAIAGQVQAPGGDAPAGGGSENAAAVFVIQLDDVSGTMAAAIHAVAASEAAQYERSLRPGDGFARIEFDCSAHVAQLTDIHTSTDIQKLTQVLSQTRETRGDTCTSEGLALARAVLEAHGAGRTPILLLTTDGEIDPGSLRTRAEEQARTDAAAAWWRGNPRIQRILVAVERGPESRRGLERLAETLDAREVPLENFATANVIERGIQQARKTPVTVATAPLALPPPAVETRLPAQFVAACAAAVLGILAFVAVWRGTARKRLLPPRPVQVPLPAIDTPRHDIHVSITVRGRTTRTIRRFPDDAEDGRVTFGESGCVVIPDLIGPPIELASAPEDRDLTLTVPPGLHVWVDGRELPPGSGAVPVHRGFTIRGAVFVSVSLMKPSRQVQGSGSVEEGVDR